MLISCPDSVVAFATPPLFDALRGGVYFIIVGFVCISLFLVLLVYRETAHKTLEELSEVFGDTAFINIAQVMVPDASQARLSMHMSPKARSSLQMSPPMVNAHMSPVVRSPSMNMHPDRSGVDASPIFGLKSDQGHGMTTQGLAVIDEVQSLRNGGSAATSQITLTQYSEEKAVSKV